MEEFLPVPLTAAKRRWAAGAMNQVTRDCGFNQAHEADGRFGPEWDHDLAPGAHLATARGRYTHHGVYAGGGTVIHYAGLARSWRAGPVEEVCLPDFALGRAVWIVKERDARFTPQEVVQRARSRLGEHDYHLLTNNCEHFSNWCVHGVHRSAQVERRLVITPLAVLLTAIVVVCLPRFLLG